MLLTSAMEIIDGRRKRRTELIESRRSEIYSLIPEISAIERRLGSTGMALLGSVADGKTSAEEAVKRIMTENKALSEKISSLLSEHGYPKDYLNPPYFCARCSDTGYTPDGKTCSCLKIEITDSALRDANLTRLMAGQTFENFRLDYYDNSVENSAGLGARDNAKSILSYVRGFAENFDTKTENLLFSGSSGLGKTFLSSAVASYLIERGKDVLYISANSLFPALEDVHFGRGDEKSNYIASKVLSAELLIVDDLGAEFITPFTTSELFRIINMRLLSNKKMVFSTNLTLAQIEQSYSGRIASRLIGNFVALRFFGEDIRKKIKYDTWLERGSL